MTDTQFTEQDAAKALVNVIGHSQWIAVALAKGFLELQKGSSLNDAADAIRKHGDLRTPMTKALSLEYANSIQAKGLLPTMPKREKTGSAENAITKLFPAVIAEKLFFEDLESLVAAHPNLKYQDDRSSGRYTVADVIIIDDSCELPINIKTATTKFMNAKTLVNIEPDDCLPIPAYKAHAALKSQPSLIYAICQDYSILEKLSTNLPSILSADESIVWSLLNQYGGSRVKSGEDAFIYAAVDTHWPNLKALAAGNDFTVISAKKAVEILRASPERTPGIGLKAWGTGARAEVNVHISISTDTTPWSTVRKRLIEKGGCDVLNGVNRTKQTLVPAPEL